MILYFRPSAGLCDAHVHEEPPSITEVNVSTYYQTKGTDKSQYPYVAFRLQFNLTGAYIFVDLFING